MIPEGEYEAGDVFLIRVDWDWGWGPEAQDYSVHVYSTQDLQVVDDRGNTNQMHMDGSEPSGFRWF